MKHKERVYELIINDFDTPEIMIVRGASTTLKRLKRCYPTVNTLKSIKSIMINFLKESNRRFY